MDEKHGETAEPTAETATENVVEAAAETETAEVSVVTDLAGLFKYSGMVDAMRDSTKVLLRHEVARATLSTMGTQYNDLRNALMAVLPADTANWTQSVDPETVTIDGLYMATVMLARWSDLVHQAPTFVLSQRVNAAQQQEVATAIAAGPQGLRALAAGAMSAAAGRPGIPTPPGQDDVNTGQYL